MTLRSKCLIAVLFLAAITIPAHAGPEEHEQR